MLKKLCLYRSLAVAALFVTTTAGLAEERPQSYWPRYETLRHAEDWSVLADSESLPAKDFFDPIKYIPLNDSGSIWVSFGGQLRIRIEGWSNFNFGAPVTEPDDDVFSLYRFLVYGDLHFGETLRVFLEGKSAFSTDRNLLGGSRTADVDQLDLQNGFLDMRLPVSSDTSLTLRGGRQELLFGKQRLVGPLDWANTRRTFDGASTILGASDWIATGFWVRLVEVFKYSFNEPDENVDLYGIYSTLKLPTDSVNMDLYWLGLHRNGAVFNGYSGTEDRHTLGTRLWGVIPSTAFDYEVEGAYQSGTLGEADIGAFMLVTRIAYTFLETPGRPQIHLEFDYASGDDEPGDGVIETFNQLYPTGHPFLGYIDTVGRQNIIDLGGGFSVRPLERASLGIDFHRFWRASNEDAFYNAAGSVVRPRDAGDSSSLGFELDLTFACQFNRHVQTLIGYSHFFPGEFIDQSGPDEDIDFVYLSLQYTF